MEAFAAASHGPRATSRPMPRRPPVTRVAFPDRLKCVSIGALGHGCGARTMFIELSIKIICLMELMSCVLHLFMCSFKIQLTRWFTPSPYHTDKNSLLTIMLHTMYGHFGPHPRVEASLISLLIPLFAERTTVNLLTHPVFYQGRCFCRRLTVCLVKSHLIIILYLRI